MKRTKLCFIKDICNFYNIMEFDYSNITNQVNILCLIGIYIDSEYNICINDNRAGINNDTIIAFTRDELHLMAGTAEPGTYYTNNPLNIKGCAHLCQNDMLYEQGMHSGKHLALRAKDELVWIYRDRNKNFKPDSNEDFYQAKGSGINIHAGSSTDKIGRWSAGCINIKGGWRGNYWKTFIRLIKNSPINLYNVALWSGRDFKRFDDNPSVFFKPVLFYSCINNKYVGFLQKVLGLKVTGKFDRATYESVCEYQRECGLINDGIVGSNTWNYLELH